MTDSTILYRCPGKHQRPGGTYDWIGANSEEEAEELVKQGWFPTLPEAIEGISAAMPTREELAQKATELGIEFDGRTSDKKLAQRIEEALQ